MTEANPRPMHRDETGRRRVLLKLSGEVFGGGEVGISTEVVRSIAKQIAATVGEVETSIVIGGGNFFRGAELSQAGMDRSRADYMGMLGTVMNSLALQDFLEQEGIDTRVQSAITMPQVAETYIPRRAIRHMQKDRVVIFGAGAGLPYFSTDTVAAQRALESTQMRFWSLRTAWTASTLLTRTRTPTLSACTTSPTMRQCSATSACWTRLRSPCAVTTT